MTYSPAENHATPVAAATPDPAPTRDFASNAGPSEELVRLLDEYFTDLRAGKSPDRARLLADHPELAGQLEACLAGLEFMARGGNADAPRQLGAFRVLREVGRGGMGVVYEAEDVLLGRRVALKVLRFGALSGPEAVERFEREAATVARLHHTNIVPIFSVGAEHGVHYYAMQFIEGRTLADVAREGPVDARRAAGWALQTAEALDHAHRHGVIHRDVKPSNLLLDADDRIWLTDFGLARRMDDATMSVTGALLGTPRYMSPEQASLVRSEIDHRTDVYSLGATLYELLSGVPAFAGDSPHQVIHAILTSDPEPPRQLHGDVPRDLDTIVMKCLEKDPGRRYASARELADDLRAWLEGRAIRARQPSLAEQAVRWLRQQRRGVLVAAGSVAATLLLTVSAMLAMNLYHRWQLGFLSLTTDEPRLVAEVLDEQDEIITPAVSVPTQQPLEVPAGEYTLRAHSPGRLRGDMRVEVPRGHKLKYDLNLEDQTLWPTIAVARSVAVVQGEGRHDLLSLDDEGLKRLNGAVGWGTWQRKLADGQTSFIPQAPGAVWPWDRAVGWRSPSGIGPFELHPRVLTEAIDLNRDGFNDYVLAARHQAWLLAVSGVDGQILWCAPRGSDVVAAPPEQGRSQPGATSGETSGNTVIWRSVGGSRGVASAVLGPPEKTPDLDADGVPDLLAAFGDLGPRADQREARRWIEAVSGASGRSIWSYELESAWFDIQVAETPEAFRWFVANSYGTSSGGGWHGSGDGIVRRSGIRSQRLGDFVYAPQPPRLINVEGQPRVLSTAGRRLILLDARTGQPAAEPFELPYRPARPVQFVEQAPSILPAIVGVEEIFSQAGQASLARVFAWSLEKQSLIWTRDGAIFPWSPAFGVDDPSWPVIEDLNDDGRPEAIFPSGHSDRQAFTGPPWGVLEACDVASGQTLWQTRLLTMDQQVDHFLVGPDIDADGYHDVFTASLWGSQFDLYIDALSGKTGERLWTSLQKSRPSDDSPERFVSRLRWWSEGADGWPRLAIAAGLAQRSQGGSSLLVVSAVSGEIVDEATQFEQFDLADLDGDGADDLVRYHAKDQMQADRGGTLDAFSGALGERWRRLGQTWQPATDFDGDHVRDLVHLGFGSAVQALSGANGRLLWTTNIQGMQSGQAPILQASDDLDGDGLADLLIASNMRGGAREFKPLHALSGRSGRVLWSADLEVHNIYRTALLTVSDLDHDGQPEVLFAAVMDWGNGQRHTWSSQDGRLWLVALSGRKGSVRWKTPLTADGQFADHQLDSLAFSPALGDLNGDGVTDVVVPAQSDADLTKFVLRAVDGARGEKLWEHVLPPALENHRPFRGIPPPLVADLDEDGVAEVYSLEFDGEPNPPLGLKTTTARLRALKATDGTSRWTWETAVDPDTGRLDDNEEKWRNRPVPRVLRRPAGGSLICLNLWGSGPRAEVVSLDSRGKVVYRTDIADRHLGFQVWTDDLTGDGAGELLFVDAPNLQAVDSASGSLLWKQHLENYQPDGISVLGVFASPPAAPTIVIQRSFPDRRIDGLDGSTGSRAWTCPGPKPKTGGAWGNLSLASILSLESGGQPPLLHFSYGQTTAAWQGRAIGQAIGAGRPRPTPRDVKMPLDPRLARRLPWKPYDARATWQTPVLFAGWAAFFCLALLLVPGATAWRMISRRRWGLRTLAVLPVVSALFVTALLIEAPETHFSRFGKLIVAATALPVVVGLAIIAGWMVRRRWRPIVSWLACSVVVAGSLAAFAISRDRPHFIEGQYYSLEGWYWVWLMSAYLTAIALCVLTALAAAIRAVRRRFWQKPTKVATA